MFEFKNKQFYMGIKNSVGVFQHYFFNFLFACLFDMLFICLFGWLFVCLFVCLLV
jgi:hypothetical protein